MNFRSLSAETLESDFERKDTGIENIKFPNNIPEHQGVGQHGKPLLIPPTVDIQPDPTIQVGPGVVVGPNVYVKGKPMPNPLLKDVLPANHPLLTNP